MEEVAPLLVKDIHKTFGSVEVLKGISAEAFKGDVISLIGASGSGKSTFLRCINLLETPTLGDIYVHGEAVKFATNKKGIRSPADPRQVAKIRSRLSMVFQGFNLWSHMTVLENIIAAPGTDSFVRFASIKVSAARKRDARASSGVTAKTGADITAVMQVAITSFSMIIWLFFKQIYLQ
ncbi:MAG: ABC-type histidine transport system ATPase subunit [Congregibacter sp.]|jgi:ABC-type histidine transport system ATPase subunit